MIGMTQTPAIGRIVHLIGPYANSNGTDVAPAIITRVWSDTMINVTAFPDCGGTTSASSVKFVADEAAARAINEGSEYPQSVAFWPPRV
jgi:hypothetical protein